ncbi:MAG: WD40 repeat domain-containing protein, partial [Flammeovirgaceae bacterium]
HWHTLSGRTLHIIDEPESPVMCLDYNSDGTLFAAAGNDKKVKLYDEQMKVKINTMKSGGFNHPGHSNRIFSLCFHKNNSNLLASGGWDNTIQFYDLKTSQVVNSIFGPHICGDSIDLKDNYLLTGSWDTKNQLQ